MAFKTAIVALSALVLLASCGPNAPPADGDADAKPDQFSEEAQSNTRLKGTLYFNYAAPLEAPHTKSLDLKSKRHSVVTDGIRPSVSKNGTIAFVDFCSALSVQLAVTDEDGFKTPLSECVDRENFSWDLQGPAISPDGKRIAVTNHKLNRARRVGESEMDYGLEAMVGKTEYIATQVFDLDGNILAEFKDMGPATWTKDGRLVMAGANEQAGYGIFVTGKDLKSPTKIDDGRIKSEISVIDAHPKSDKVAIVYNGQLFEMSLSDGKPKRIHSHGTQLGGIAYSPTGKEIAMVSVDTLQEAMELGGGGYPIYILEDGETEMIRLPFVIEGPLDWTD